MGDSRSWSTMSSGAEVRWRGSVNGNDARVVVTKGSTTYCAAEVNRPDALGKDSWVVPDLLTQVAILHAAFSDDDKT
jgi:hypothetical protein